ncbi:hypothetical protein I540_2897 [Mycobacteroides abscessus subsp. bolletii 1513]|uniref:Uncharacterized protein n=1 Tax=Mycobacteroides abscessus subsp. bolletii 1513 TaxID=1299321 RepID=X8DVA1_9MYCO|nr:hypothetical protein I540_2897 [Mycobacteroides abscessus subsp. bolletii 1513]
MTATAGIDPIIVKILEAVPIQLVSPDGPQASRDAYRAIATARPPWIEVANIEDRTIPAPPATYRFGSTRPPRAEYVRFSC